MLIRNFLPSEFKALWHNYFAVILICKIRYACLTSAPEARRFQHDGYGETYPQVALL